MKIVDIRAFPFSFPLPPGGPRIGVEIGEDFIKAHPPIEGPGYV